MLRSDRDIAVETAVKDLTTKVLDNPNAINAFKLHIDPDHAAPAE